MRRALFGACGLATLRQRCPLRDELLRSGGERILMTFAEVEKLVGELPASAWNFPWWWANEHPRTTRHVQCKAWATVGYGLRRREQTDSFIHEIERAPGQQRPLGFHCRLGQRSQTFKMLFKIGITPARAVTIDENDPAQHPSIINPWPAVALGEVRLKPRHLLIRQPIKVAHA